MSRLINLVDSLLGDLYGNLSSVELMNKAATIDLAMYETRSFAINWKRARRQTTGRVVLMSMVLGQLQGPDYDFIHLGGLIAFEPRLIVLLIFAVLPAFISEAYFSRYSYSLVKAGHPNVASWIISGISVRGGTTKEIKVFGLDYFFVRSI